MSDCIFCQIVRGEIPSSKVYEDDRIMAFWDINKQVPVHILVIPKRHLRSVMELGLADGELLTQIFAAIRAIAKEQGVSETGFRVLSNSGPDSGQMVDHLHFHILGGRKLGALG